MPTERFKSKEAYRKNLAYRHIHGIPFTATNVVVGGKEHKVKHSGGERAQIDAKQRRKVKMRTESHAYNFRQHRGGRKAGC